MKDTKRIITSSDDEDFEWARADFNIRLSSPILIYGDIGLWDGRRSGYKTIKSGYLGEIFDTGGELCEWYLDDKSDLRCTASHHDGINYYLYRQIKETATEDEIESLKKKIVDGEATYADFEKCTDKIGHRIEQILVQEYWEPSDEEKNSNVM